MRKFISFFHVLFLLPNFVSGEVIEIFSLNHIDERTDYCIDIKVHKFYANVKNGIRAHTRHLYQGEITVGQRFDLHKLIYNRFNIAFFNVCMEIKLLNASKSLQLKNIEMTNFRDLNGIIKEEFIPFLIWIYVLPLLKESLKRRKGIFCTFNPKHLT